MTNSLSCQNVSESFENWVRYLRIYYLISEHLFCVRDQNNKKCYVIIFSLGEIIKEQPSLELIFFVMP